MATVVGVDVGGTFTDFIGFDATSGRLMVDKRPTTLEDQSIAVADAIRAFDDSAGTIDQVVHGTTTATNALIERQGAKTALVATQGFRDVLECGRRERPSVYGLRGSFTPLVDRNARFEVAGRLDRHGAEAEQLDADDVERVVEALRDGGYESVAISLMHSYANGAHESVIHDAISSALPDVYVARSSTVYAEIGEFERTSTAVISAYVGPVMRRYFSSLDRRLREAGFGRDYLVVQSNAGAIRYQMAIRYPATTITSGPAGGVNAAVTIARSEGIDDVVSLDMGGTSADIAVAVGGRVGKSMENSIGFRLPLQVPMLDIATIGAGGGSIAWLDDAGILRVGPRSAGAAPGPACYGRGGTRATVTDAHLLLGHLPASAMRENGLPELDVAAARGAVERTIAGPLGLGVEAAAEAVLEVVNENMAGQIRLETVEQGLDVRRFHLVGFGGAGPLHVCALIRKLGVRGAIVPVFPGITSALGCTLCSAQHDFARTIRRRLDDMSVAEIRTVFDEQRRDGEDLLTQQGLDVAGAVQECSLTMLYEGQRHTISVDFPDHAPESPDEIRARFDERYQVLYGNLLNLARVVVSLRSSVMVPLERLDLKACFARLRDAASVPDATVPSWFAGSAHEAALVARSTLDVGREVPGPAIITQRDSTTIIEPGFVARVTPGGSLLVTRSG
jgi:N-methylhydantoinase A